MIEWNGDQMKRKARAAALSGLDAIAQKCVDGAKSDHPGWKNKTGAAEASIGIISPANEDGAGAAVQWGSSGVAYMIWLELNHGSAMRNQADLNYPNLAAEVAKGLGNG